MKKLLLLLFLIPNLVTAASAFEELNPSNPFNIVILPFKLIGDDMPNQSIEEVIRHDLNKSGYFYASTSGLLGDREINLDILSIYSSKDAVVYGEIRKQNDDIYDLYFYVVDTITKKMLYSRRLAVHHGGFRKIGHFLSDKIYEIFIDATGSYDTKLAYVTVSEHANGDKTYKLEISDSDGYNPQTLVKSSKPILSPAWSPDQNQIAYISFKNDQAEAFVKNPYDKSLPIMLPKLDGIAAEPSWHPNGESVLLTLSTSYNEGNYKGFNQDIYSYNLNSKKLERLTTHPSDDTEANYSPDGRNIVFSSNRNDKKQIFIKNLNTEVIYRVPVNSPYLSDPVFSPDGTKLAFIQEINRDNRLTLYDIKSNTLKILTKNRLDNSPSFSPSGEWLIFATTRTNKEILSIISLPKNQIVELTSKDASVIEPTWLNFRKKYQSSLNNEELFAYLVKEQESSVIIVPPNAYKSSDPIGWTCIPEYVKVGNYCYVKIENGYYNASGDVVCNTGYIWQSNKYFVMTCQREEKNETGLAENNIEVDFWNSIEDSDDPEEYRIYLEEYPGGKFAKLAELRIKKLGDTTIPNLDYGRYHALVIGNDRYRHIKPLSNAVNDANSVASLLRSKYQFNVDVLTNATRDEIVSALFTLRKTISAKDNLLVYYAGHGWLDKDTDEGYWLPVDAVDDNQVDWIPNSTIINSVRAIKAKHVMVVADSCFSGTLTRGIKIRELSSDYLKEIVEKKSRTVLTSGGLEPVSDVGGGDNSVFAAAFMRILNENTGVMDGHQFFTTLRKQVMTNADQTPEYGDIRKAGHDGGDFLFVRQ